MKEMKGKERKKDRKKERKDSIESICKKTI